MLDPSLPFKFGLGLIFMAIGFVIISIGAQVALSEGLAGAKWLLLTYLFHTIGELILKPYWSCSNFIFIAKKIYWSDDGGLVFSIFPWCNSSRSNFWTSY